MDNPSIPLFGPYSLRKTPEAEWWTFFRANYRKVFGSTADFQYMSLLSEEEKSNIETLSKAFEQVRTYFYLIYHGDEPIGWTSGRQDHADRMYMENTGILPAHQGKGIYSAMLPILLELIRKQGFQRVYSRHNAVNNAILIPKMKAGFLITSMELSEKYGLLIHLSYYFNEFRLNALRFRSGQDHLMEEVAKNYRMFKED